MTLKVFFAHHYLYFSKIPFDCFLTDLSKVVVEIDENLNLISDKLDGESRKNVQLQSDHGVERKSDKIDKLAIDFETFRSEHVKSSERVKTLKEVVSEHVNNLRLMTLLSLTELKQRLVCDGEDPQSLSAFVRILLAKSYSVHICGFS